jgi:hypothetical protein
VHDVAAVVEADVLVECGVGDLWLFGANGEVVSGAGVEADHSWALLHVRQERLQD